VRAFSGGITSGDLTVDIGGSAAGRISLTANPTVVPASGGTSSLLAVVFDTDGNRLPGVPVSFTTTAGSIASAVVTTNGSGEAATTITTNRDADVTASAGGASGGSGGSGGGDGNGGGGGTATAAVTATVKITAAAGPAVSISAAGTPTEDTPTVFSITATPVAPAAIRTITVDFGDGSTPQTIGNTTSVAHTYRSSGTFTVTATAEDTNGSRGTGSTIIVVAQSAPPLVNLTITPSTATTGQIVSFRADISQNPSNVPVESVFWDFGDGNTRNSQSLTTSTIYGASGTFLARVTVRFTNGNTSFAEAAVRIN
jgi:PKD repeat protein